MALGCICSTKKIGTRNEMGRPFVLRIRAQCAEKTNALLRESEYFGPILKKHLAMTMNGKEGLVKRMGCYLKWAPDGPIPITIIETNPNRLFFAVYSRNGAIFIIYHFIPISAASMACFSSEEEARPVWEFLNL